jgi:hypothetical protein
MEVLLGKSVGDFPMAFPMVSMTFQGQRSISVPSPLDLAATQRGKFWRNNSGYLVYYWKLGITLVIPISTRLPKVKYKPRITLVYYWMHAFLCSLPLRVLNVVGI